MMIPTLSRKIIALGVSAVSIAASAFAATVVPESEWGYVPVGDDHLAICSADKSRTTSAIAKSTAGDIEIPSVLWSRQVVSIGEQAFEGCANLTSVVIPDGVTNIAKRAFYGCTSLTNVVIPASVKAIGEIAFYNCRNLQKILCAGGAEISIGRAAFMNCSSVEKIEMSATDLVDVRDGGFSGCVRAGTCELRAKTVDVAGKAFSSYSYGGGHNGAVCEGISNVAIVARASASIGVDAFASCGNLLAVNISAGTTSSIGAGAFSECAKLHAVELPDVLESLASNMFYKCSSLKSLACPTNLKQIAYRAFNACTELENVTFCNGLEKIEDLAFFGCSSLSSLEFPQSVGNIGSSAFEECGSVARVEFRDGDTNLKEGDTNLASTAGVVIGDRAFYDCSAITNITFSQRINSFGSRAFAQCGALESVVMPTNLTAISESAFEDCSSLTTLELPLSLESIGVAAFRGCSSFSEFSIPTNRTVAVGANAFLSTKYWNDWPNDSIVVNNGYVLGFKGNPVSVVLPDGCKSIPAGMFENMTNLTSVTLPAGVVSVGARAFANSGITELALKDASVIGVSAFEGCSKLASVMLSDNLSDIPDNAFANCESLKTIDIPDSVTTVGIKAFYACSALQTIVGGDSVVSIGDYAFANCTSLEPKRFASDVRYGVHVFQGCRWNDYVQFPSVGTLQEEYPESYSNIRSVVFSYGLTNIVDDACRGCTALEYVDIPSSVVSVGSNAFYGCSSVTSVVMAAGVNAVASNAFAGCSNIVSATVSGAVPVMMLFPDAYATLKDIKVAQECDSLCDDLFRGCAALAAIDIPWTVTSIGARAFYGCTSLGKDGVMIPERVTSIGDEAFAYCLSLGSVRFLCPKPTDVATNIYYGANADLVSAVLQPYKDSWQPVMSNSWPEASGPVCGRRIMWWHTDCLAKITFAYYNGTGGAQYQYYLKNAGRVVEELPEAPESSESATDKYGDFIGWFTKPYGGEQVEEGFEVTTSMTLYAHWSVDEDDEDDWDYDFSTAHEYSGYVLNGEALAGIVQIKIGKGRYSSADEETNAVATAVFQLLGEGKVTAKGVLHEDASGELVHSKSSRELTFSIDGGTINGSFDGMDVIASRNIFSSSARSDKAKANAVIDDVGGNYNVAVLADADGDYGFSGYACMSLQIAGKGNVKVSGTLPDGTKLSTSCSLLLVEEMVCVPVVMAAYSGKKGGLAFMLNLSEGDVVIGNISDWIGPAGVVLGSLEAVDVSRVSNLQNGEHQFAADVSGIEISGESIDDSFSPDGTVVAVSSGKWKLPRPDTVRFVKGEGYEVVKDNGNPSGLKLSYVSKTGLFKGSFKLFGETDAGKSKKRTVTVSGAVVNGVGYGCACIKKVGGIPVVVE